MIIVGGYQVVKGLINADIRAVEAALQPVNPNPLAHPTL